MQSNSLKWNSKTKTLNKSPSNKQTTNRAQRPKTEQGQAQGLGNRLYSLLSLQIKCISQQHYEYNINVDIVYTFHKLFYNLPHEYCDHRSFRLRGTAETYWVYPNVQFIKKGNIVLSFSIYKAATVP